MVFIGALGFLVYGSKKKITKFSTLSAKLCTMRWKHLVKGKFYGNWQFWASISIIDFSCKKYIKV